MRGRSGRPERRASDANARGARPVSFLRMSVKPACMGLYLILLLGENNDRAVSQGDVFPAF